jgi:hypothetical protein
MAYTAAFKSADPLVKKELEKQKQDIEGLNNQIKELTKDKNSKEEIIKGEQARATAGPKASGAAPVKEAAASNPRTIPFQSSSIVLLKRFVAKAVPSKTIDTATILILEGNFFSKNISKTTPIQTVCINKTIPIETGMY